MLDLVTFILKTFDNQGIPVQKRLVCRRAFHNPHFFCKTRQILPGGNHFKKAVHPVMLKTPEGRITELSWCFLTMHFVCKGQGRYQKRMIIFISGKVQLSGQIQVPEKTKPFFNYSGEFNFPAAQYKHG